MSEINDQVERVVKGGVAWVELSLDRTFQGLEVYIKTLPQIEAFMKGLGDGRASALNAYGRSWIPTKGGTPLEVYGLDKTLSNPGFTIDGICEPLKPEKGIGKLNLSFLRFAGIGSPQGVRFIITGPFSRTFVHTVKDDILVQISTLIKDYIVPVHLILRISSQELP